MSLKNPLTPTGIDPGTVRLVAQRLNHYATPGPSNLECNIYSTVEGVILLVFTVKMTELKVLI
jgi:hypothetical protein